MAYLVLKTKIIDNSESSQAYVDGSVVAVGFYCVSSEFLYCYGGFLLNVPIAKNERFVETVWHSGHLK